MNTNEETLHTYVTVKRFTGGALKGLTATDTAQYLSAPWVAGVAVAAPIMGGSPYVIVSCTRID